MKSLLTVSLFCMLVLLCDAQQIRVLTSGAQTSLRGLSVVDDQVIWASGSNGMVGLSTDGGQHWKWQQVKGFEKNDFRDIEGFDGKTAVIMAVGEPAYILKTFNGGETWKTVYADSSKGIFLDAMEFWENGNGVAVGDPLDGKIYVTRTADFGNTWKRYAGKELPAVEAGEAMFASSGTNLRKLSNLEAMVVTGGARSRLLIHERFIDLPLLQGTTSTGANSLAIWNVPPRKPRIIVVGGDYKLDTASAGNCAYSTDLGKHWKQPDVPPHGYRSCVEFLDGEQAITCGTSGVDLTEDGGKTWKLVSRESFHVCQKARKGKRLLLAGTGGRIAEFVF